MKKNRIGKCVFATIVIVIASYSVARYYLYNDYSNDAAVEYLVEHAESRSKSSCALYVRRAISAGGCPTFGQPPSACDYDLFLPDLGFNEVPQDGYVPQKGDVVVFSAIKWHKHGHICMYDGKQWVSDFKQRSMYSASAYRTQGINTYWRRPDGKAWRKISLKSWRRAMSGQGTGQCPTHFSQATGETRLFRRTLTCPLQGQGTGP